MRPSAAHHTSVISSAEARSQLAMMLCNATPERFAGFTADGLARMYRVRAAEIGEMLAAEKERRDEWARCHG
jgi:hypothetical protein